VIVVLVKQDRIDVNLGRTRFVKHCLAALGLPPGDTLVFLISLIFRCDWVY